MLYQFIMVDLKISNQTDQRVLEGTKLARLSFLDGSFELIALSHHFLYDFQPSWTMSLEGFCAVDFRVSIENIGVQNEEIGKRGCS